VSQLDLVIRGGTLGEGVVDLGIAAGRVAQIGGEMHGATELDAHGKLVLPGGVDAHVHLSVAPTETTETTGPRWVDDFASGSAAALAGGVTTLGNMTFGTPDEGLLDALERETAVAEQQTIADIFLHPVVGVPDERVLDEIPRLLEHGCSSLKIFLSNPRFDRHVDGYLAAIQRAGASGLISMLHCEDASVMTYATRLLVEQGHTSLRYFPESRPVAAEVLATQRAVAFTEVTGAPVYLVHLSSARALDVCAEAKTRGLPVYVETRPLYLHLTESVFDAEPDCGRFVGQPPLRQASDVAALWAGLSQGLIDTVCTDHAPWSLAAKLDPELSIERLRPGVENLQLLLPMLYSEGVRSGRLSLQRLVELTSTNAARLFGLYPRKGVLAVGSDADVVIFDPDLERTVTASMLHSNADYSVYEGWKVTGWPILTLRRGEIVFRDDQVSGQRGSGRVLACGPAGRL
jgi:dihydropyrimidinase